MLRARPVLALMFGLSLACGCGDDEGSGDPLGSRTILVPLRYTEDSNFGPKGASGTAEIETTSGRVSITVTGLQKLETDEYEGWLAGGGRKAVSTGKFNTDFSGLGSSEKTLGDISKRTYTRVMITVEPKPDSDPNPDSRQSIGGEIPPPP